MTPEQHLSKVMELGFRLGSGEADAFDKVFKPKDDRTHCGCGQEIATLPVKNLIGVQRDEDGKIFCYLINCFCGSTRTYPYGRHD